MGMRSNGSGAAPVRAPHWLRERLVELENDPAIDPLVERLSGVAYGLASGRRGELLRGNWQGHALHPLLTDVPVGCWTSAAVLDLVGGKSSRRAAKRLIGLGLLSVPATAATGMADWSTERSPKVRRVGAVHAVGNVAASLIYFLSWRARRRDHHLRGKALGMLGLSVASATGYLGAHMAFARNAGGGMRGMDLDAAAGGAGGLVDIERASELIGVPAEQVRAMVDEGMLDVVSSTDGVDRFREDEVLALRLLGA